jgi:CBS domain-containing protein
MKTADLMTSTVITITPGHSVRHAARLMLEHGISGLPVVDDMGTVVGMLTEGDLLRRVEPAEADKVDAMWYRLATPEGVARDFVKRHSWRVGDVMTSPVVFVTGQTPLRHVAELLETHGIRRLPVVERGQLIGIIGRSDLLRCLVGQLPEQPIQGDEALRICVAARLGDERHAFTRKPEVTVESGVVTCGARWDRKASAMPRG